MKKDLIESGAIDIGELIVPIEYFTMRVNKDGTLVRELFWNNLSESNN